MLERIIKNRELVFAISGGVFLAAGYTAETFFAETLPEAALIFYILSYLIGGFYKAKEGYIDIRYNKKLSVEILMILAAIGAASIGFWNEGAILIFIFAMSGALETYTLNKSERDLSKLIELAPLEANRYIGSSNELETVGVDELKTGDFILIKNAERVPADGTIISGTTVIDESAITGESVPAAKTANDPVYNGTMNGNGAVVVRVDKENKDSLFQKMIALVNEAKQNRPPSQQLIEKIEGPYVMTVLIAVVLMLIVPPVVFASPFEETFYQAMVLLVVASPCAVVASVMPALLSAISNGARRGVLVKGGTFLEQLGKASAAAFDKTGTITQGTPAVTDFAECTADGNGSALLEAVVAIEAQSNHPLARAIVNFGESRGIEKHNGVDETEDITGHGVKATYRGRVYRIGNLQMMANVLNGSKKNAPDLPDSIDSRRKQWQSEGKTVIYIAEERSVVGALALKDEIRPEAKKLIAKLNDQGVKTIMITGDHEATASAIAKECGLDSWISNCLPEEKVEEVKSLQQKYGNVVMVGDGVNDAPAIALSDVGIAMGSGTDVAIETADIVLMKNDLARITHTFLLSRRLNRIVMQNLIFSVSVIALLITYNFAGDLSLPLGVIGHEGSTILVILNGLRLLRG
ncbi:heavy metal translocating P-type ATPase [Salisediminibacterium halotolerans]|uniref:Cd2+/Zn2+-exporting ATPase n=1 Tax=Salisediminibacterium halotolerans TaxID=517425 RepID=A0A1H9QWJ0_9BACI|nr:heavy metal translocating P-type ATPase [Salisediminibacterium haloalkalitolerans]SER64073.1 Cd2+/Zn2+-exporting ATPase [Salisediminibacterium haloalkalitolerans]